MKKFLVASDIHGSLVALQRVMTILDETKADKLILLGDIFGTNASEMVQILNSIKHKLTIVKGNNDWWLDIEGVEFLWQKEAYENINGKVAYLCHGHKLNDMFLEGYNAEIIMIGHLHRPVLRKEKGITILCPGSIAVPRGGAEKTYALIDDKKIQILTDYGEIVDELLF